MTCKVKRLVAPPKGDADWNKTPWNNIKPELIQNYMGEKPEHRPKTEVKMAYDDTTIYLIFRVEDKHIRAVAKKNQDSVCADSCVEFFFTPCSDISKGYFNLEMNCGGTMLFHLQYIPRGDRVIIPENELKLITKAHSLPKIVDPEITEPTTWTVEYGIPISLLEKYFKVTTPNPKVTWRANFYKCGDQTSHPHWLTWAPVDCPTPDFHVPQSFGTLEFE